MTEQRTVSTDRLVDAMEEAFERGQELTLVITGWSMMPTLRPHRDKAILVSPERRPLKKNEIAIFKRPDGHLVIHRVIRINEAAGTVTLNGDAQSWTEDRDIDSLLGVAEAVVRKGRRISCDGFWWKFYVNLWAVTRPVRGLLVAARRKILHTGAQPED
ncbi:MAG: S24/S26 family peptidase [Eubacterium sp.]|nr:S24/S26 family peptidase [Eubacterium sp.]